MTHTPRFHRVDMPWIKAVMQDGYTELHRRMMNRGIAGPIKLQVYFALRDYLADRLIDNTDAVMFELIAEKLP